MGIKNEYKHTLTCDAPRCKVEYATTANTVNMDTSKAVSDGWKLWQGRWYCPGCAKEARIYTWQHIIKAYLIERGLGVYKQNCSCVADTFTGECMRDCSIGHVNYCSTCKHEDICDKRGSKGAYIGPILCYEGKEVKS